MSHRGVPAGFRPLSPASAEWKTEMPSVFGPSGTNGDKDQVSEEDRLGSGDKSGR